MRSGWRKAAKTSLWGAALVVVSMAGAAAPSMAQERLEQDFGIIKACAGDVWRLCSDVLPDIGKMKACMQDKMGQLPKACLDKLLDAMAGSTFKVCKDRPMRFARRRAATSTTASPIASARKSTATASVCRFPWARTWTSARSTPPVPATNTW